MKNSRISTMFLIAAVLWPVLAAHAAPRHGMQAKSTFLQVDHSNEIKKASVNHTGNPFSQAGYGEEHHKSDRLRCGITEQVGAFTDKYEDCPASCPYFAQNRKDSQHCTFLCVPGEECGRWNPNKPIPDSIKNSKTCRGPKVAFCSEASLDGSDTCQKCSSGFDLHDGQCFFSWWNLVMGVTAVFVVIFTVVIVWTVDLCCREDVNGEVVKKTNDWRYRSRIYKEVPGQSAEIWPMATNTTHHGHNIAGPGMTLHFNFQMFFILWPIFVALVWVVLACVHNELFILGTRKFGTPRHNCILVAWGYETQQRLMWTKVLFLAIVYVVSFVSFLVFSIRQLRIYEFMDAAEKTMKDFAVEIKGLPPIKGSDHNIEDKIQKAVTEKTGKECIGVSICWNYGEEQEKVDFAINMDLALRESEMPGGMPVPNPQKIPPPENMGAVRTWMYNKEKALLGPDEPCIKDDEVSELLDSLESSDAAFAIFNSEQDKNDVVALGTMTLKCEGFEEEVTVELLEVANEPANVNWHNFGDNSPSTMIGNFLKGFFTVYVPALLIWFFGFYVPYACSLYYFNYDNGAELPGYYSIIFTIVVCGGNATMYVVCDVCCDIIGFRYKDTKQKAYMLMYLAACMLNVFLDMAVTYGTALKIMIGLDFRTYHGQRLSEIDTFTEQFETYAMQRSLGENTFAYAWPSTFFLCFVLEPFVTIWIPHAIGKVVVRTHPEIVGTTAEAYLAAFEFDMGRYADILLNVFLGILIFWFPGGYIWSLFFFMAFSHSFIYFFDHWRVLNVIPTVKIVICDVDWWAQAVMCFLCAMIMGCLVFKANCETYTNYCLQDMKLITTCSLAGTAHFIVHFLLLIFFVPMMCPEYEDENGDLNYEAVARIEPRSWFSMNPVHCLRSKFIHEQKPHCMMCAYGKEHFLQTNDKIHAYFQQEAAVIEEGFDIKKRLSGLSQSLRLSGSTPEEKLEETPKA